MPRSPASASASAAEAGRSGSASAGSPDKAAVAALSARRRHWRASRARASRRSSSGIAGSIVPAELSLVAKIVASSPSPIGRIFGRIAERTPNLSPSTWVNALERLRAARRLGT
ncbi:hypothetical protein [Jiella pelagia]|uniref:hypothetical protein n=1 Tax=Jiella pelagia TaxID=2986949 RepID=UPI0022A7AD8B|nr:hypothetical protein [Jiella pelagia]